MKLTKDERETVGAMFGGRCAYCGDPLPDRWHADHVEPVLRDMHYVFGKGWVPNGKVLAPENHRLSNIMPSCPPCNIDKHRMSLEEWRKKLADGCNVLRRHNPTYRHSLRFGLVSETGSSITFYFELDANKSRPLKGCAADRDGDCDHRDCPQLRDGEPAKTGRHCPLDHREDDE